MAINRISGKMLQDNLLREGADIAIETSLLYIDVTNDRVGVNTDTPALALDVNGSSKIANVTTIGSAINSVVGDLALNSTSGNITVSDKKIILCADPTADQDVVNKRFLDNIISGFNLDKIVAGDSDLTVIDTGTGSSYSYTLDGGVVATMDATLFDLTMPITTTGTITTDGELNALTAQIGDLNISANTLSSDTGVIEITSGMQLTGATASRVPYTNVSEILITSPNLKFNGTKFEVTGEIVVDDIKIDANTITAADTLVLTTTANGNLTLTSAAGIIVLDSSAAALLPSGTDLERPGSATAGMIRWNETSGLAEIYDGAFWRTVQRGFNVTSQQILGDNITVTFVLNKTATTDGILVIINGIVQDPQGGAVYSVIGTALTFTSAPSGTDVISIRFLEF